MVYFIFEALYCRFFFFFHFNEALIALRLEITFVLLSSSFPPFLLLIRFFFFLSPVIVPPPPPKRYYLLFLPSTDYFFLFVRIRFLSLIVSGMDATIPVVYLHRSKRFSALRSRRSLAFFSPFSSFFSFYSFILSRPRLSD